VKERRTKMQMARLGDGRTETEIWYRLSSLDAARDKEDDGGCGAAMVR
jgi:hypothetical protein